LQIHQVFFQIIQSGFEGGRLAVLFDLLFEQADNRRQGAEIIVAGHMPFDARFIFDQPDQGLDQIAPRFYRTARALSSRGC